MRILLTSDLHYKLRQYDWLIGAAASFDAIVVAGDHMDAFLPVPPEVQIAALSASLARISGMVRLDINLPPQSAGQRDRHERKVGMRVKTLNTGRYLSLA